MSLYLSFFIGIVLLGSAFFFMARKAVSLGEGLGKKSATVCLTLTFLIWGFGLLEAFLIIPRNVDSKPPTPTIFKDYKAHPHYLLRNTILYIVPPTYTYHTFGHKFTANRLGFRDRNFELKKPKGVFRILIFGASLTFGVAIDTDHRYSNILELMLREKYPNKKIEILNFGMPAYNYDQEHDLMKALLKEVTCDLIIMGVPGDRLEMTTKKSLSVTSSMGNIRISKLNEAFSLPKKIFSNLDRNLSTIRHNEPDDFFSKSRWHKKLGLYQIIASRTQIDSDQMIPNDNRLNYQIKEWRGIFDLLRKNQMPPPIAVLLYRGDVDPSNNDFLHPRGGLAKNIRLLQFLADRLKYEGFDIADPLPFFVEHSGMSMAVSEWEGHPNYLSHYLYAKALFEKLIKNNSIK